MNFSNPINRFLIGVYSPLFLEFIIYETYLFLKPNYEPNFMLLIISVPLVLPLIFFYFISPYIIFTLSSSGEHYGLALKKGINEIFISEKNVLDENEVEIVKNKLESTLIPELKRQFRASYANSYFTQTHEDHVSEYSVLNFYETIYLFSLFSIFYSFFNAFITTYLHYNRLEIEHIIIADKISDPLNVYIFTLFMISLGVSGILLILILNRRIRIFISIVNPGWVNLSSENDTLIMQVRAISDFNFDDILNDDLVNSKNFMTDLFHNLLNERIEKVVDATTREIVGKQLTWQLYSEILTELNIEEKKKSRLEESFLSSPLIKTAQQFAFDKREARSLQEDFKFFNTSIENWDSQSDSEKLSAFLMLYRSAESLFRGILRSMGSDTGNFGNMMLSLSNLGLLNNDEQIILNQVRRQRNYILHRAGEKITIQKKFAEEFLHVVENILVRADNPDNNGNSKILT